MEHYWNTEIDENFNAELFDFRFKEEEYKMYSSNAVFSSFKADEGSLILTAVLIEYINDYLTNLSSDELEFFNALDIGCGNGIISLLLASCIVAYQGDMIDISQRAIALAKMNINQFSCEEKLNVFASDKFAEIDKKYDIIYTNPPIRTGKKNVYAIFENSKEYLKDEGLFFAVIRKSHGAKSAIKKLHDVYGNCEIVKKSKGFYVIISKKVS